jgi:hypothetical protein
MTSPDPGSDSNFDGAFNFADLAGAIAAVPELKSQPSLAVTVAQSGPGAVGTAQGLVGTVQQTNAGQVVKRVHSDGMFQHLLHAVNGIRNGVWDSVPYRDQISHGGSVAAHAIFAPMDEVAHLANAPLGGVQHNYRFIRDVWDKHGAMAGIGELLAASVGGVVGGVGGFFVGGPAGALYGAALGSEGALQLAGRLGPFGDSWSRTENGEKYRLGGYPVSLGRDVAHAVGLNPGGNQTAQDIVNSIPIVGLWLGQPIHHQDLYHSVSGAIDGTADVAGDPLLAGGKLLQMNRARTVITSSGDFDRIAADAMRLHDGGSPAILTTGAAGTPTVMTAANRAYRMFKDVAASDTGQIIEHYPVLRPLAPQLGAAGTVPDVIDVFRNNLATAEFLGTKGVASYSLTRVPARKLADALRNVTPTDLSEASTARKVVSFPANAVRDLTETLVRGASNRTPFAIDPTTREILTTGWDPSNPRAAGILYKIVRLTDSAEVARAVSTRFGSEVDPARQYEIWQNAHAKVITQALQSHGVNSPDVIERVVADLTDHSGMAGAGRDSRYGYGPDGNPVDRLPVGPDGASSGSPLWETQAGKLYTIHPSTLTSVAKALSSNPLVRATGKIDDGLYHHIVAPIFKPQALLTGGFAFRNSGNEMLTRVIGQEGLGILRVAVEKAADKMGYRLSKSSPHLPDEVDHVTAALSEAASPEALMKNPHLLDTASRLILESDGHILPPGASSAHAATGYGGDDLSDLKDNTSRMIAAATGRGKGGEVLDPHNFVDYTTANGEKFGHALSGALAMVARDPAGPIMAKAYRDALAAGAGEDAASAAGVRAGVAFLRDTERGQYQTTLLKSGQVSATPEVDPLTDWSTRRMLAIKGLVHGQNGEVNRTILDGLADHNTPVLGRTAGSLHPSLHPDKLNELPAESLPIKVAGMETKPVGDVGVVQRIQNKGFSFLGDLINRMSREPIYISHVDEEYKLAKTVPGLTDEEAWTLAKTRAVERMIPEIHNPMDRSQFALAARNFIPFLFAREQSYRRLANGVLENPLGFRKIQLVAHAMKNVGFIQTDDQGHDSFAYPLSGEIATQLPALLKSLGIDTAVGIPAGFRGSITGLYAGGESPDHLAGVGWSPLVNIPMRALASLDPQTAELWNKVEGPVSSQQSTLSMFIPNSWVRNAVTAMLPAVQQRSFNNAQIDALQFAISRGDLPPNPTMADGRPDPAYVAWMDRFYTHTRIMFGMKALFGIGAPSSPQLTQGSKELSKLAQGYIDKFGLADGTRKMFEEHPNLTSYQVFRTEATSGLPDTQKAVQWAAKNNKFIDTFGKAATFFAPQSGIVDPGAQAARDAEVRLGLRARRTPNDYVHEVVAQTGWNEYQQAKNARDTAIDAHPGDNEFANLQYANFTNYLKNDLGRRNPVFYSQYLNLTANSIEQKNLVEQTRAILNSKAYPPGSEPAARIISGLMSDYDNHLAVLAAKGGNAGMSTQAAQSAERANWKSYLTSYATAHPEATMIVNRLFKGA